jgi:hypothetical protein
MVGTYVPSTATTISSGMSYGTGNGFGSGTLNGEEAGGGGGGTSYADGTW